MSIPIHAQVHGLHIASEVPLPELARHVPAAGASARPPDVRVQRRSVAAAADDPPDRWFFVRADGTAILRVTGVATYAIRDGRVIDVDAAASADPAEVRVYLLGSALGVLLHQRGELPLHISAVVIDGRAWAFTAPSGTGKSTLAAALHLHAGLPLVTDDVGVARAGPDPGLRGRTGADGVWLWPGPQLLKLCADAHADVADVAPPPLPEYATSAKVRLRVAHGDVVAPVPLAGIVLLQRHAVDAAPDVWTSAADLPVDLRTDLPGDPGDDEDVLRVRRVHGAAAFLVMQAAVYRLSHGVAVTSRTAVFDRIGRLAGSVPCHIGILSGSTQPASPERARGVARVLRGLDVPQAAGGVTA